MNEETQPACRHTEGPFHSCSYVDERNALIRKAEDIANNRVSIVGPGIRVETVAGMHWSRAFVEAMDALAAKYGVTSGVVVKRANETRRAA